MGNFSRDTFDRLKHFVGVRLQQGVPIVDADWNEMEDIRKYELRDFIRKVIGNGVPEGNNGFAVFAVADTNDFGIRGGDGTAEGAGDILADGWDVVNESAIQYTAQPLFNDNDLAAEWSVDPIPPLTTPAANRNDLVYLDAWEREVDSTEDPDHLVNPAIGIETAVRLKREWAVRVVEGSNALPAAPSGHFFLALAQIARTGGSANIVAADIADQRQTGLNLASLETGVAALESEVTDARGNQSNLGNRLDQSLTNNGSLRQNTVGNTQVPDGGLTESKVVFNASGHNHSGGANGSLVGASSLPDDSITANKINFEVINTGSINNLAPGASREIVVDAEYDGRIYFPVISAADIDEVGPGTLLVGRVTIQPVFVVIADVSGQDDKFAYYVRITNSAEATGSIDVTWHVYAIAEG